MQGTVQLSKGKLSLTPFLPPIYSRVQSGDDNVGRSEGELENGDRASNRGA